MTRLDATLVKQKLARSRQRAQDMVQAGKVNVNGEVVTKPSHRVSEEDEILLLEQDHPYVSRAALKLKGLLDKLDLCFDEETVLDIGASTGGFTQVALEYGAAHVYAVDVGTGQFAEELKKDSRVTSFEQTDARNVTLETFSESPTILLADISFVGLQKILPTVLEQITTLEKACVLVKPQFELHPSYVGKNGIVKREEDRRRALRDVLDCIETCGFSVRHEMQSVLAGSDGNIEYMVYAAKV